MTEPTDLTHSEEENSLPHSTNTQEKRKKNAEKERKKDRRKTEERKKTERKKERKKNYCGQLRRIRIPAIKDL